jgi:hypothetical protein
VSRRKKRANYTPPQHKLPRDDWTIGLPMLDALLNWGVIRRLRFVDRLRLL